MCICALTCTIWVLGGPGGVAYQCAEPLAGAVKGIPVRGQAYSVDYILSSEIKQLPLQSPYNELCKATHSPHCMNRDGGANSLPTAYDRLFVTCSTSTLRDHKPDEARRWRAKRHN